MGKESKKLIANNKKARFDYFILESFETGIELFGTEVKSLRLGQCSIKESWVDIKYGEVFIYGTIKEKGLTLVPLEVYLKGRLVKVEIGLAQGKKKYDKRATIAKNDARREVEREFKGSVRY